MHNQIFIFFFLFILHLQISQTILARNIPKIKIKPNHKISIPEIKHHLHRFGYLKHKNESDDVLFRHAITHYQKNLGLPITGTLNTETLSQINLPRCGVPDVKDPKTSTFRTTQHYVYFPGQPRWTQNNIPLKLTYAFSHNNLTPYLSLTNIQRVFQRAFIKWASVIPVSFIETEDYTIADIKIGFFAGDHGDGEPFDGVLGVLGHTFSPENGRIHLDNDEIWAVDFKEEQSSVAVDLESVAIHEIGHALGLGHSSVKEAAMYPTLKPRSKKLNLGIDDVVGVQSLYGTNPNFTLSGLLASETTSVSSDARNLMIESTGFVFVYTVLVLGFLSL